MRVYSHGMLWTEFKYTCQECQCEFIYKLKDVEEGIEYNFTTGTGRAYRYLVCPECQTKNTFIDPITGKKYYDLIYQSDEPPSPTEIIYDGGDEDRDDVIIYDSGDEG